VGGALQRKNTPTDGRSAEMTGKTNSEKKKGVYSSQNSLRLRLGGRSPAAEPLENRSGRGRVREAKNTWDPGKTAR